MNITSTLPVRVSLAWLKWTSAFGFVVVACEALGLT